MKNKKIIFICAFIFIASLYHACKKYDEGPAFSMRSKKTRLTGEWKVTSYLKNGEDFLNYVDKIETDYDYNCSSQYTDTSSGTSGFIFEFDKNDDVILSETFSETGKRNYVYNYNCSDYTFSDSGTEITFGSWEFKKKKEELRLEMNYNGSLTIEDYEIVRLTNDELKLKGFIGGGYNIPIEKVEIELKKI